MIRKKYYKLINTEEIDKLAYDAALQSLKGTLIDDIGNILCITTGDLIRCIITAYIKHLPTDIEFVQRHQIPQGERHDERQ